MGEKSSYLLFPEKVCNLQIKNATLEFVDQGQILEITYELLRAETEAAAVHRGEDSEFEEVM